MANMVLDKVGIKFMKDQEGIPTNKQGDAVAYQDERGIWTIGWGHTAGVKKGDVWPIEKAISQFKIDVDSQYGKCVNTYIKTTMTQNQFNAMTSLCYNIGVSNNPKFPGFPQSQVCKKFNAGDIKGASKAFLGWVKPVSLTARRLREIKLFNTPDTTKPIAPDKPKPVVITDKNKVATDKAKADAIAKTNAQIKLGDKLREQDLKEELAEKEKIKKAELSKDKNAIAKAKAEATANAKARKIKSDLQKANAIKNAKALKIKNDLALKSKEGMTNTKSQPIDAKGKTLPNGAFDFSKVKVLKSGISLIGVLAIGLLLYNGEIGETELE